MVTAAAALLLLISATAGCLGWWGEGDDEDTITLYGFSIKGEVFDERIIPAFQRMWRNRTGRTVEFETSYAGSGRITQQVKVGAPAEVMILSTEWDAIQLRKAGLVDDDWRSRPWNDSGACLRLKGTRLFWIFPSR